MTEIEIAQQALILKITSGDKLLTIKNKINLPAGYQSIIKRFFDTFEVTSIEPAAAKPELPTERELNIHL